MFPDSKLLTPVMGFFEIHHGSHWGTSRWWSGRLRSRKQEVLVGQGLCPAEKLDLWCLGMAWLPHMAPAAISWESGNEEKIRHAHTHTPKKHDRISETSIKSWPNRRKHMKIPKNLGVGAAEVRTAALKITPLEGSKHKKYPAWCRKWWCTHPEAPPLPTWIDGC